jgi:hypothetical protein
VRQEINLEEMHKHLPLLAMMVDLDRRGGFLAQSDLERAVDIICEGDPQATGPHSGLH